MKTEKARSFKLGDVISYPYDTPQSCRPCERSEAKTDIDQSLHPLAAVENCTAGSIEPADGTFILRKGERHEKAKPGNHP